MTLRSPWMARLANIDASLSERLAMALAKDMSDGLSRDRSLTRLSPIGRADRAAAGRPCQPAGLGPLLLLLFRSRIISLS